MQPTTGESSPPGLVELVPLCDTPEPDGCLMPLPAPGELFHLLTPEEAQCRAATNAAIANAVELEAHWATVIIECDSRYVRRNVCLQRDLLELHAADVRNKAAANALEVFYQLAALEARKHYLDRAIEEAEQSAALAEDLHASGLEMEVDREELNVRRTEMEHQKLQLQYARIQLNGQLQKLIGCPVSEHDFIWPAVNWTPDMNPLDADAELAAALPNRFDLRGLQLVLCKLEKSTLRVARGVLGVPDGTLGSVEPTEGWIHRLRCIRCSDHEVDVRCRQLALLYNDTEQVATAEIKGAVYEIAVQQHRVAVARQAVEDRQTALEGLEMLRDVDDTAVFQISQARNRLWDAQAELVQQVAALKIAQVHLSRAEALLAAQCGFAPRLCCEDGECNGACMRQKAPTCCSGKRSCKCDKCKCL